MRAKKLWAIAYFAAAHLCVGCDGGPGAAGADGGTEGEADLSVSALDADVGVEVGGAGDAGAEDGGDDVGTEDGVNDDSGSDLTPDTGADADAGDATVSCGWQNCDDGSECTLDSCVGGKCVHDIAGVFPGCCEGPLPVLWQHKLVEENPGGPTISTFGAVASDGGVSVLTHELVTKSWGTIALWHLDRYGQQEWMVDKTVQPTAKYDYPFSPRAVSVRKKGGIVIAAVTMYSYPALPLTVWEWSQGGGQLWQVQMDGDLSALAADDADGFSAILTKKGNDIGEQDQFTLAHFHKAVLDWKLPLTAAEAGGSLMVDGAGNTLLSQGTTIRTYGTSGKLLAERTQPFATIPLFRFPDDQFLAWTTKGFARLDTAGEILWHQNYPTLPIMPVPVPGDADAFLGLSGESGDRLSLIRGPGALQWSVNFPDENSLKIQYGTGIAVGPDGRIFIARSISGYSMYTGPSIRVEARDPWGHGDCATSASCVGISLASCDDANDCTADICTTAAGCKHSPVLDGSNCLGAAGSCGFQHCKAGSCTLSGTSPAACDDDSTCTADACEPATGCTHTAIAGTCNDGVACTSDDHCAAGGCVGVPSCATPCTSSSDSCDDGDPCTSDNCLTTCHHIAVDCSDSNDCTADSCGPGGKCVSVAVLDNAYCKAGQPTLILVDCDDQNACTLDTWFAAAGCTHTDLPSGFACQSGKQCLLGVCK